MPISKDNSNTKSAKKSSYKTRSKSNEDNKKLKKHNDSDSDNDMSTHSDSEEDCDEMDMHEYRKFLGKMFPSKYLKNKIKKDLSLNK